MKIIKNESDERIGQLKSASIVEYHDDGRSVRVYKWLYRNRDIELHDCYRTKKMIDRFEPDYLVSACLFIDRKIQYGSHCGHFWSTPLAVFDWLDELIRVEDELNGNRPKEHPDYRHYEDAVAVLSGMSQRHQTEILIGLTDQQRKLYEYIRDYILKNNYSPTYEQMCNDLGYSKNALGTMCGRVKVLIKMGLLKRERYGRFIELP